MYRPLLSSPSSRSSTPRKKAPRPLPRHTRFYCTQHHTPVSTSPPNRNPARFYPTMSPSTTLKPRLSKSSPHIPSLCAPPSVRKPRKSPLKRPPAHLLNSARISARHLVQRRPRRLLPPRLRTPSHPMPTGTASEASSIMSSLPSWTLSRRLRMPCPPNRLSRRRSLPPSPYPSPTSMPPRPRTSTLSACSFPQQTCAT